MHISNTERQNDLTIKIVIKSFSDYLAHNKGTVRMILRHTLILLSAFIAILPLSAQKTGKKIAISGIVVDGKRNPVPNVFITIDGKITNSVTNGQGYYKIKVAPNAGKIGFSTIWAEGTEEEINGRTTINHTLDVPFTKNEPNENSVSEGEISGQSATAIKENKNFSSYKNIYELIQGEFPSILVQGKSIKIPGSVSLKLSTEPLFIVDGIEVLSVDNIVPSNIRSVQVLKGSSASIYGMKGANGVIIINLLGSKDNNILKL